MPRSKTRKTSTHRNQRSIIGHFGYTSLAILILQALSLTAITILQYGIFNHIPVNKNQNTSDTISLGSLFFGHTQSLNETTTQEPNYIVTAFLWIALGVVAILLSIYLTKILSAMFHRITKALYRKATPQKLLIVKLLVAGVAFFAIAGIALLLPAVEHTMPVNIFILATCVMAFIAQHSLANHRKVPTKNIL